MHGNPLTELTTDAVFLRRVIVVLAISGLIALVILLADLLLLIVAAIIVAVVLRAAAAPISRISHISDRWAVGIATLLIAGLLTGAAVLFGPQIADQMVLLLEALPAASAKLTAAMQETAWGSIVIDNLEEAGVYAARFVTQVPLFAIGLAGIIANVVLALVGGVMLALEPARYRSGMLLLVPKRLRGSLRRAFNASGHALKGWLLAQLASMAVIGVMTGVGLWIVGVPSALGLGLFAGLAQFVPYVGPIISAIPGLMIAGATSLDIFIWAAVVYGGVQQVDDNLITPWIQQRIAGIPMALSLFALVAFGVLFGPVGIILATPLTLIALVLVLSLYVRDVLGEDISLPGEPNRTRRSRKPREIAAIPAAA